MRYKLFFGAILAAGILFAAVSFMPGSSDAQETADVPQAPQAMPVTVEAVRARNVQIWREFSGRIQAVDYVEIRPQVSGKITEIKFNGGARVKTGDVLFVIDPRPYQAAVNKSQAALDSANNTYSLAEKEVVRARELIKTNAISKRQYDERVSARLVALSDVEAAKAALEQAQINLDYTNVTAPISGKTSRAEITLGNLVEAGNPVLTSIVSDEGVYADFEVDEKTYLENIRQMSGGVQKIAVKLSIPSLPDQKYEGFIHSFDNRINPSTGTIRARAYFPNTDRMLIPGMFVTVSMGSPTDEKKIMVSERVISTDQNRKFVLVVDDNSVASYRPVTLGETTGGERVVLTGLQEGDRVITEGLMHIRPGMPVVPQVGGAQAAQAEPAAAASPPESAE